MRQNVFRWGAFFVALTCSAPAFSAGFHIREQGAKAMAMGNAFVAQADDPSAVFYNPAGISFLEGTQVSLGVTVIDVPETEFDGATWLGDPALPESEFHGRQSARSDVFFPPNLYLTHTMSTSPFAFGLGINSLFPLAKRWDTTSPFRDDVKEIAIKPINVNPNVSYRHGNVAVAVGVDYTRATVWLENTPYTTIFDGAGNPINLNVGDLEVEGSGDGWGWNVGLLWKPTDFLSLGFSYRSEIEIDVKGNDGDADLAVSQMAQTLLGFPSHVNTNGSTEITLPDIISFAVAWMPTRQLTLEFDADRFGWSSYDELTLNFEDETILHDATLAKDWKDVWAFRFGAQYAVTPWLDLRGGYAYDNTPVPDATLGPDLPDADRHNLTAGLGFHTERGGLDLAYMAVLFRDRDVSNEFQDGEYESEAHLVAANVSYRF